MKLTFVILNKTGNFISFLIKTKQIKRKSKQKYYSANRLINFIMSNNSEITFIKPHWTIYMGM